MGVVALLSCVVHLQLVVTLKHTTYNSTQYTLTAMSCLAAGAIHPLTQLPHPEPFRSLNTFPAISCAWLQVLLNP